MLELWGMRSTPSLPLLPGLLWPGVVAPDAIISNIDAYQEEMIRLRHNLHRKNHPERITSAPRNLDGRIADNTRKPTSVSLPYVKEQAERIQKICSPYDIRTIFTSGSTLRRYLFRVKRTTEFKMIKNCVYSIPCNCGKIYKGETGRPLKVRLEHRCAIEKSGMADHICKGKKRETICPYWVKLK